MANSVPQPGGNSNPGDGEPAGGDPFATRAAAIAYIREGFAVVAYPAKQKKPVGNDWQHRPLTLEQAAGLDNHVNLGLLLGLVSGGLYDVDCDVPQARKAWARHGLATDRVHGRPGSRRSHYWYICLDEPDHARVVFDFTEPHTIGARDKQTQTYIELRGGNANSAAQTMVPPSTHPNGEQLAWARNGKVAVVTYAELYRLVARTAAETLVARHWPGRGSRDEAAMALAGGLIRGTDWTDEEIDDFAETVAWLAKDEEHGDRDKAEATRAKVDAGDEATGWPTLKKKLRNGDAVVKTLMEWLDIRPGGRARDGRLTVHTRDGIAKMERAVLGELAKASDPASGEPRVYVRNGQLVRIRYDENDRPVVSPLNKAALASEVDTLVQFRAHYKSGDTHPVMPPEEVINATLVARRYDLPPLAGISEVPLLRPDGSVLHTPGYDVATGMLYRPVVGATQVPAVPDNPTNDQVRQAVALIDEAVGDFPYATESDRAHAFAALLSLVLRAALGDNLQPMPLFDAPTVGTGKTLLAATIGTIGIGKHTAVPTPSDEAEWTKVITTTLIQGRPFNVFDNATGSVKSSSLAMVLSSKSFSPRLLGKNESPDLRNDTVWAMTANNLRLSLDLARRTYRVRLDAKTAKPWKRESGGFQHPNLPQWVESNRHRLLHAVLTLARAWYARGKLAPAGGVPQLGGFETWAATVGGILAVAGVVGFLANQDDLWDSADNTTEEWEAFLWQWYEIFGSGHVKTKRIYEAVREQLDIAHDRFCEYPELRDVVPSELAESVRKGTFPKQLGYALRAHVETRYGDANYRVVFVKKDDHDGTSIWQVVKG